jgi:hypothetical protein
MRASPDSERGCAKNEDRDGHAPAAAGAQARAWLIRMAFVGSAVCGIVLTGGAAARADTGVVSGDVQTVTTTTTTSTTTATTTTATTTTVDSTTGAVDRVLEAVGSTAQQDTDTATDTGVATTQTPTGVVTSAIDETLDRTKSATSDVVNAVADTIDGTLRESPIDPVAGVVDHATGTRTGSSILDPSAGIGTRSGTPAGDSFDHRVPTSAQRRAAAVTAAGRSKMLDASHAAGPSAPVGTAGTGETPPPAPLRPAPGASTPALPSDGAATALALALIGAILLRSSPAPPGGWHRHAPPTTLFHGAAVALAVERPG